MDYQHFVNQIKDRVAQSFGAGMSLQIHTTLKNNGKERVGLTIADQQLNILPTIYLEEYYQQFQEGFSLDYIAESIFDLYQEVKISHTWDVNKIKDFDSIRSLITYKLINTEKNSTLLQSLPHIPYMDLSIVFYILFEIDDSGAATIPITSELLHFWNVSPEEIYEIAQKNSPKLLPATFKPMRVVVEELTGIVTDSHVLDQDIMFVLSNPLRSFGASCILYNGILEQLACYFGENFFVLPSSVHEMVIIPESQSPSKDELLEMVKEINETQVELEEVLSDNVYYYDFQKRELN